MTTPTGRPHDAPGATGGALGRPDVPVAVAQEIARITSRFGRLPTLCGIDDLKSVCNVALLKCTGKESIGLLHIIIRRAMQMEIRRSLRGGKEMVSMVQEPTVKLPSSMNAAAVKDALAKLPFDEGQMLSSVYYGKETVGSIAKSSKRTRAEVVKVYRSAIDHLKEMLRG